MHHSLLPALGGLGPARVREARSALRAHGGAGRRARDPKTPHLVRVRAAHEIKMAAGRRRGRARRQSAEQVKDSERGVFARFLAAHKNSSSRTRRPRRPPGPSAVPAYGREH